MGVHHMQMTAGRMILVAALGLPLLAGLYLLAVGPGTELYRAFLGWVFIEQRAFHGSMTQALQDFSKSAGVNTGWAIVFGSFLYGVFHAAGPGHGKVILSTYLLTQPEKVKKSVALAAISALVQGLVAISLVYGLFYLFGLVSKDMKLAVSWSERLAFALVIAIGLMLIWRAVKGFGWFAGGNDHAHHHHAHDHDHFGEVCETCGHNHTPTSDQIDRATDLRSTIGVILSIGLRPCSGAVLVLVFARFTGIPWAGIMSVLAISLGTALTVSAIAVLSVQARKLALSLAGSGTVWVDRVAWSLALAGGVVLILLGWGLMAASFDAPVRSMGL
ncbi:MAG: nickel/cobalt transporter [Rhizobiaceae bacterium]